MHKEGKSSHQTKINTRSTGRDSLDLRQCSQGGEKACSAGSDNILLMTVQYTLQSQHQAASDRPKQQNDAALARAVKYGNHDLGYPCAVPVGKEMEQERAGKAVAD